MFHGIVPRKFSSSADCGTDPAGGGGAFAGGWAELPLSLGAAAHAAEAELRDERWAMAAREQSREWCVAPALAVRAEEGERVVVFEQVGDGGEVDGGGGHALSIARGRARGVSLAPFGGGGAHGALPNGRHGRVRIRSNRPQS